MRMIDAVLRHNFGWPTVINPIIPAFCETTEKGRYVNTKFAVVDPEQLGALPKIVADNVAWFYYVENKKEYWDLHKDFGSFAPPMPRFWVEYLLPDRAVSEELGEVQLPGDTLRIYVGSLFDYWAYRDGWILSVSCCTWESKTDILGPQMRCVQIQLDHDGNVSQSGPGGMIGTLLTIDLTSGRDEVDEDIGFYPFHPQLLAVSFMNCRNVITQTVRPPQKLVARQIKRGAHPLVQYKIIKVVPFADKKRVLRAGAGEPAYHQSLHMVAGNIARYGPKYGTGLLFGKYEGQFYRPAHLAGRLSEGLVVKDYEIEKPKPH